jgi:hypothetical protein
VVSIHYAIAANRQWPEFKELFGATFTGHPWNEEIGVTIEEREHPLAAAFAGTDFRIADEIYEYGAPFDRGKLRVLLSLDPARSNMGVKWINRKDNDFALAWVKPHGKGRVFNTSFGHRTEIYWNPEVLQFYLDAIQFAAGDLVAATEPRPTRPVRKISGTEPAPGLAGFVSLFNGRDLDGWDGDGRFWSVREGVIVGQTTPDVRVNENSFLIWKDEVEDFELRLKFKLEGGNSGIYYRARKRPPGQTKGEALIGTQADFSADGRWTGVIMEYTLRDVLAERAEKVRIDSNGKREVIILRRRGEMAAVVKTNDWNDYTVIARGGQVKLAINSTPIMRIGRSRSQTVGARLARFAGSRRPADAGPVQGHLPEAPLSQAGCIVPGQPSLCEIAHRNGEPSDPPNGSRLCQKARRSGSSARRSAEGQCASSVQYAAGAVAHSRGPVRRKLPQFQHCASEP